jgi:hypothetical protein
VIPQHSGRTQIEGVCEKNAKEVLGPETDRRMKVAAGQRELHNVGLDNLQFS